MNWWKSFKMEKQFSDEEKIAFLNYLRLDKELPIELHLNNAVEFPAIQFDTKNILTKAFLPSEEWLQWSNYYLMQTSNRFEINISNHHHIDSQFYNYGEKFAQIVEKSEIHNTVCIADFPTEQLLAFAVGAKNVFEPILGFDSLPHALGITSSTTILEMLYQWKEEFKTEHTQKLPLLLLDANRLVHYTDNPTQFDNRSTAKLPTIESLKQRNILTIIYVTNNDNDIDDVHEDFCFYVNAGISLLWFNTQNNKGIIEKEYIKRSTMFSKRISFINKV